MSIKNNLKKKEKGIALIQIFILAVSIISFAYYIGEEFRIVSAINPTPAEDAARMMSKDAAAKASIITSNPKGLTFFQAVEAQIGSIITAATIAVGLYYGSKMLGEMIWGEGSSIANKLANILTISFSIGTAAGIGLSIASKMGVSLAQNSIWAFMASSNPLGFTGVLKDLFGGSLFAGAGGGLIGVGIGLFIFFVTAKEERIDAVQFNCLPWQPKSGGDNCEQCNKGFLPCSEYKCQSLGAGCELLNKGTDKETCAYNNRNDITPPTISSWNSPLEQNYVYIPASATLPEKATGTSGVILNYTASSDGCIPPFTFVPFGITLNKPGKCRIDSQRKDNFSEMSYLVSSGYSIYNHTLYTYSPGLAEAEKEGIPITGDGDREVYVRCEGVNGISNVGTFVFKFCVQKEPDITAAKIVLTNPLNDMPISSGRDSQETVFYTDKPADCKWSHRDEEYSLMTETMNCVKSLSEMGTNMLYKCITNLTGIEDSSENKFYIKCKSYPLNEEKDRVENSESYIYTLKGTEPLVIDSVEPTNGTLMKGSTSSVKVLLTVKTSAGYDKGKAWCSYNETSGTGTNGKYVLFANTNSYESTQELWLGEGYYDYSVRCCDLGANCDSKNTDFEVEIDTKEPRVIRLYNEGEELKIVTNEISNCVYDTVDCSYEFDEGIVMTTMDNLNHYVDWDIDSNFFIKCKDEYENKPNPDQCSVIARPFTSY